MKHIRNLSYSRNSVAKESAQLADAKGDFFDTILRAWQDFLFAKKNEVV